MTDNANDGEPPLAPWLDAISRLEMGEQPNLPVELHCNTQGFRLLLGDANSAADAKLLQSQGVTHILNASDVYEPALEDAYEQAGIDYLMLDASDDQDYDMRQHFAEATAFIRLARDGGTACLVHCQAGINRSGFIAAAELVVNERRPLLEVVRDCTRLRGVFLTNTNFQLQLAQLAREHGLLGERPNAPAAKAPQDTPASRISGQQLYRQEKQAATASKKSSACALL
jgi:predicted protein tyrosine phosphatase